MASEKMALDSGSIPLYLYHGIVDSKDGFDEDLSLYLCNLTSDPGEKMASDPSFVPLDNLPAGHDWTAPDWFKSLIANMLQLDPAKRPTATDVLAKMEKCHGNKGLL